MKSKSIKLLITNNHSHHHSVALGHNDSHPIYQPSDQVQSPHVSSNQQSLSPPSQPMCLSEFQKQSISQNQSKSMFTIREEESYEYQSDLGSICLNKKLVESRIDQFSTIRAEDNKENYHSNFINLKSSKFLSSFSSENTRNNLGQFGHLSENPSKQGSKLRQYQTTGSINTIKNSMEDIAPNIEAWQQKINAKIQKQGDTQQEQILEQKIFVLKQNQKSLKLNKSKIPPFEIQMKGNQKIKRGFDIIYSCSERQLEQIMKILEKQGIKLIKRQNQLFREKINQDIPQQNIDTSINRSTNIMISKNKTQPKIQSLDPKQKQKKKLKIKMIRPKDKKSQQIEKQKQKQ